MLSEKEKRICFLIDNVIAFFYVSFLIFWFLRFWPVTVNYFIFVFIFMSIFYTLFWFIFSLSFAWDGLMSQTNSEGAAEHLLDEERINFASVDLSLLNFYDYNRFYVAPYFEVMASWTQDEDEEVWDWLHNPSYKLKRITEDYAFDWLDAEWSETMPILCRGFPQQIFPEFWPDFFEEELDDKARRSFVIIAEEGFLDGKRTKGLYHPDVVEKHQKNTRWWRLSKKRDRSWRARNIVKAAFTASPSALPLNVLLEEGHSFLHPEQDVNSVLTIDNISELGWIAVMEEIFLSEEDAMDQNWEYTDE